MGVEFFLEVGKVAIAWGKCVAEEVSCFGDGSVEARAFVSKDFSVSSFFGETVESLEAASSVGVSSGEATVIDGGTNTWAFRAARCWGGSAVRGDFSWSEENWLHRSSKSGKVCSAAKVVLYRLRKDCMVSAESVKGNEAVEGSVWMGEGQPAGLGEPVVRVEGREGVGLETSFLKLRFSSRLAINCKLFLAKRPRSDILTGSKNQALSPSLWCACTGYFRELSLHQSRPCST